MYIYILPEGLQLAILVPVLDDCFEAFSAMASAAEGGREGLGDLGITEC